MFAYPLPSIPIHFQTILIENQSNPIGIDPKSKKGLSDAGGRLGRRRPAALFFEKSGRLGCGDGIRRCRLCSHILCHQFQPIFSPFSLKINQILLESTPNLNFPSACYPPNDINEQDPCIQEENSSTKIHEGHIGMALAEFQSNIWVLLINVIWRRENSNLGSIPIGFD